MLIYEIFKMSKTNIPSHTDHVSLGVHFVTSFYLISFRRLLGLPMPKLTSNVKVHNEFFTYWKIANNNANYLQPQRQYQL